MKTTRLSPGKKVTVTRQYSRVDAAEAEVLIDAAVANLRGFMLCLAGLFGEGRRDRDHFRAGSGERPV